MAFDTITIIFNPQSTGDAPGIAAQLYKDLKKVYPKSNILKAPTKHAGHAEELAQKAARGSNKPLIISVSGDGGYHEVINGVLNSGNKNAVATVEGAGNANDHWRVVHDNKPIIDRLKSKPYNISALKIEVSGGENFERYAHSYIGLGISAKIGQALNQEKLNKFNEKKILLENLFRVKAFKIKLNNQVKTLNSLIAANINEMAKAIKLEPDLKLSTPKFRLIMNRHHSPWRLVAHMVGAALVADDEPKRLESIEFETLTPVWLQCDGEVTKLPKSCTVRISGKKDAIRTI